MQHHADALINGARSRRHLGGAAPVGRLERRPVDLPPEDCHFVAEHDDFDRQVRPRSTDEPDQLEDTTERLV